MHPQSTTPKVCSVDGCNKASRARGMCVMHYRRWRIHGDVTTKLVPSYVRPPFVSPSCSVDGCELPSTRRGWCTLHYQRWRNQGDPEKTLLPQRVMGTPAERFWAKVEVTEGCWLWRGAITSDGYGTFSIATSTSMLAHHFLAGKPPDGFCWDHICHTFDTSCHGGITCTHRRCVRPDHLEAVTSQENTRRGRSRWQERA